MGTLENPDTGEELAGTIGYPEGVIEIRGRDT
jgi:hypothetical protein